MKTANCFRFFSKSALHACLLSFVFWGGCPLANAATSQAPNALKAQQFFCSAGYNHQDCGQHVARLRALLGRYGMGVQGPWSWIIVRSEDWQPFLERLHVDRRTPAFTALAEGETYLEESLFLPPSKRASELEHDFGAPFEQLLSIAVTHELGHALCRDGNEAAANRISDQLRNGKMPVCDESPKSLTPFDEFYLEKIIRFAAPAVIPGHISWEHVDSQGALLVRELHEEMRLRIDKSGSPLG